MSTVSNRALVWSCIEAYNARDADLVAAFFAADARERGQMVGREGVRQCALSLFRAFPDWQVVVESMAAEGDLVMTRVLQGGTHLDVLNAPTLFGGLLAGVPPTGRRIAVRQLQEWRVVDGVVLAQWPLCDDLGAVRQLGLRRWGS